MRNRINIYHDELIKRREDYYRRKLNHNNEIIFIKIDFIEHCKKKNFKNERKRIQRWLEVL